MSVPRIFVSTGTLVPSTPAIAIPRLLKTPLYLPHRLGLAPSPDRFIEDSAYGPLKELGGCWVETLSWLGLNSRGASVAKAKAKLRQLKQQHPGCKVILVGQSQGGLIAAELVLDPEFAGCIAAVVFAGTPFLGSPVIDSRWLKWATVFPGVDAMQVEHRSLQALGWRIEADWPEEVLVLLAASSRDGLVSEESAFGVQFPSGTEVRWCRLDDHRRGSHVRMCRGGLVPVIKELRKELTPIEELIAA
jgi:pimeloyl-ACP methyl ester carboxylesterase